MSPERLERYLNAAGGDLEKALRGYTRNARLSEAFYTPLQGVEIAIRNAFHKQLVKAFGQFWYDELDKQNILDPQKDRKTPGTLLKLREARQYLQEKGKPETSSRMAAELSFGFWVGICAKRYQKDLWNPFLNNPFKGLSLTRRDVFERLEKIRNLRNRIAHHEPILNRNLPNDYANILETIRWICGASANWIEATSCFRERWGEPIAPVPFENLTEEAVFNLKTAAELLNLSPDELARHAVLAVAKDSHAWRSVILPMRDDGKAPKQ